MIVAILGGGQLGQMLAIAGQRLGFACRVLEPDASCPAASVAETIVGPYDDPARLAALVDGVDVATYEFENVPRAAAEWIERFAEGAVGADFRGLRPTARSLEIAQDRIREKEFFVQCGVPVQPYASIASAGDFDDALAKVGTPAILKTRRYGYDGKGQRRIRAADEVGPAWGQLGEVPCILEAFVPFVREVSVLAVRDAAGSVRCWPLVENVHVDGILALSRVPASDATALESSAQGYAAAVAEALGHVGVLAIEFFVVADGAGGVALIANEMAPRVHNSGHWTIEGATTSQFENHLRAIVDLPLGPVDAIAESTMINLVGTVPDLTAIRGEPGVHVHLYGKAPRPGRKLGHVTVCGDDAAARRIVDALWARSWAAEAADESAPAALPR